MIRVLITDDSVFMRTILKDIFDRDPHIDVVGTAANGIEALEKISELNPDVVTLDIRMPQMDGISTLEAIQALNSRPKVLMLSTLTSEDAELTKTALELGADDFVLKPRNIAKVRGLEQEITGKIKNLFRFSAYTGSKKSAEEAAEYVVVIGSSAGAPTMLDWIVSSLPAGLNAGIVITQHMPDGFTKPFADRLDRISRLQVKETENGGLIRKGSVLISKAGQHSVITKTLLAAGTPGGKIVHSNAPAIHGVRPAVDMTFSSAARTYGSRTAAILLSGMGHDGGDGMQEVHATGGHTIAVREEDCLVYGMIRTALERGAVDEIVPLKLLPYRIVEIVDAMEAKA